MQNNQPPQNELPRPEGTMKKELEVIKQFCKEHMDEQFSNLLDFVPEALEKRGLRIVPEVTWKERAKTLGVTFAVAAVGGYAGYKLGKWLDGRGVKVQVELEKETNGTSRNRTIGPRLTAVAN